jgi:NAD(P)-dependent dehydrogenase (short-subunit alcohol dehydrogenase family)
MSFFSGKRIVLTGASRGVGYEASKLFLTAGAEVIGTGRDAARLEKVSAELQSIGNFTPFLADFDTPDAPKNLAEFVRGKWDSVDYLLNNAAVQTYRSDWREEGLELLNEQWRCNVFAQHELIFRMQDLLEKGSEPRVVNVSSGAGSLQALKESPDSRPTDSPNMHSED